MDTEQLVEEYGFFFSWGRAFTLKEISEFIGSTRDTKILRKALLRDPRFVYFNSTPFDEDRFILDISLYKWFANLNCKLAKAFKYRLSERQLALVSSYLRKEGQWDITPSELIKWGKSIGFILNSYSKGYYVFPLAHTLSYFVDDAFEIAKSVLDEIGEKRAWEKVNIERIRELIEMGLSKFGQRTTYVVAAREGLFDIFGDETFTYTKLGSHLGVTRERARQIHEHFFQRIKNSPSKYLKPFLFVFFHEFMRVAGELLLHKSSSETNLRFSTKACGLPLVDLTELKLSIIGFCPEGRSNNKTQTSNKYLEKYLKPPLPLMKTPETIQAELDPDCISKRLDQEAQVTLGKKQMRYFAGLIAEARKENIKLETRVWLALRAIGRPAHYSKVTQVYNRLFPNSPLKDSNIRSSLNRGRNGIVWVGAKGIYAFKDWGYERPTESLFDTVTEIVRNIYKRTKKPVPFSMIMTEIGRYRKIVKRTSVLMAAHINADLRCVSKNVFIPRESSREKKVDEDFDEQLDRILRDFKKRET